MIDANTRAEIEALVTEFSFRIDHGDAAGIPELFTESGRFESSLATLNGGALLPGKHSRCCHPPDRTRPEQQEN